MVHACVAMHVELASTCGHMPTASVGMAPGERGHGTRRAWAWHPAHGERGHGARHGTRRKSSLPGFSFFFVFFLVLVDEGLGFFQASHGVVETEFLLGLVAVTAGEFAGWY